MKLISVVAFMVIVQFLCAQEGDERATTYHINGSVSITNNGFSFIPSFSLGKPALIAYPSIGGERFSLDPQIRYDLEGFKPWSFVLVWRYKAIQTERFHLTLGTHLPALLFSEQTIVVEGSSKEYFINSRYITPELIPRYSLSKKISLGMHIMSGFGLKKEDQARRLQFISLQASFNQLRLIGKTYVSWNPQIYYLNLDGTGGFYIAQSIAVGHQKFPIEVATMMNKVLRTDLSTKNFDWNISLIYTFRNQLVKY